MAKGARKNPSPAQDKLTAAEQEIITRVADGESYRSIARAYGVGLGRLAEWMDAAPERSQACARAREQAAQAYEERALEAVEGAQTPFELMRAREIAVHMRWRAKAANPRRYGDRQQVDIDATIATLTPEQVDAKINRLLTAAKVSSGGTPA